MKRLRIILFDDTKARAWQPFALTRPVGELRLGAFTFRQRAERVLGGRCVGHLTGEALIGFDEPGAAPVLRSAHDARAVAGAHDARDARGARGAHDAADTTAPLLLLCARALLDWRAAEALSAGAGSGTSGVVRVGGRAAGWYARDGAAPPADVLTALLDDCESAAEQPPAAELPGVLLDYVWQLVARNADQIRADFAAHPAGEPTDVQPAHTHGIGRTRLRLGEAVTIEPNVVFDFTDGPIWLEEGVHVRAFARLAGPLHVAAGSTLFGGSYAAASIGPHCKVRGELEESVFLGYSNKAHDGFLGHAYVGCWVNLGALTTNSDLKNNYGSIRMWTPEGDVDTGLTKLGCLLGDHVKTGIGVLLNTGTVMGAGANVWGAELPPKYVPPFRWGSGSELGEYEIDRFLATAEIVMRRRDVTLSDGMRAVLRRAAGH